MTARALETSDVARLVLAHWVEGVTVDQKRIMLAARLNNGLTMTFVHGETTYPSEECIPALWDDALNIAKFIAHTTGLKIPKQEREAA